MFIIILAYYMGCNGWQGLVMLYYNKLLNLKLHQLFCNNLLKS